MPIRHKMLDLYLLTFNCARNLVDPAALAPSLFSALAPSTPIPDVLAISLQEVSPIAYAFLGGSFLDPYFKRVHETVHRAVELRSNGTTDSGVQLKHVTTRSLGLTALMIFARPEVVDRMIWMQYASAGVGLWDMGNKGAVAVRLGIACPTEEEEETLSLTFTSAHLAPFETNFEARNRDWEALVRNLAFENDEGSGSHVSLSQPGEAEAEPLLASCALSEGTQSQAPPEGTGLFAHTNAALFIAGDLNYRTSDSPPTKVAHHPLAEPNPPYTGPPPPDTISSTQQYERLLADDQLTRELEAGRTLHNMSELPITFPPTYKITHSSSAAPESEDWSWAAHRYPSWCDRILFYSSDASGKDKVLEPLRYDALPIQRTSDHRPVALSVRIYDKNMGEARVSPEKEAPFPINPDWRQRRDSARRFEVLVGVASYLVLTGKGRAMMLGALGVALGTWWLLG